MHIVSCMYIYHVSAMCIYIYICIYVLSIIEGINKAKHEIP